MPPVSLRPVRADDLPVLAGIHSEELDPWSFFSLRASNGLERAFASDGLISEDAGTLAVEVADGALAGSVGWHPVWYGPTSACRSFNIGITLVPEHRGRGHGVAAQAELARYLFRTTLAERVEATTDVANSREQRALDKAGFTREGVLRHAQFRSGQWHDMVVYSVLRHEAADAG